jgi:hypothetical protein
MARAVEEVENGRAVKDDFTLFVRSTFTSTASATSITEPVDDVDRPPRDGRSPPAPLNPAGARRAITETGGCAGLERVD